MTDRELLLIVAAVRYCENEKVVYETNQDRTQDAIDEAKWALGKVRGELDTLAEHRRGDG